MKDNKSLIGLLGEKISKLQTPLRSVEYSFNNGYSCALEDVEKILRQAAEELEEEDDGLAIEGAPNPDLDIPQPKNRRIEKLAWEFKSGDDRELRLKINELIDYLNQGIEE